MRRQDIPDDAVRSNANRPAPRALRRQEGRIGWIALWLVGVPVPLLFLLYFLRGCT